MQKINLTGIKNLVFDLGGVIVTLDRDEAVRRFTAIGAYNADDSLNAYRQNGIYRALEMGEISLEVFYAFFRRRNGSDASDAEINNAWLGFMKEVSLAKLQLLEDLRARGYKLYLLSNTNTVIMQWARSTAFSAAGKPIDAYFDRMYLSFEMHYMKPDPQIFQRMTADAGILPEETLFIDDGRENIQTAKKLGFHTFWPANGDDFCPLFYA
jgi:putative hydrolase of the HAD superfamily